MLIVNEDAQLVDLLQKTLRLDKPGYETRVVRDGFSAGFVFSDVRPDVVVLDMAHSGMDALEACRHIKQSEAGADTMVVGIGRQGEQGECERILEVGAAHCFPRPVDGAGFRTALQEATQNRSR